jgi:hypothetical protein
MKRKPKIQSTLTNVCSQIWEMNDVNSAKELLIDYVNGTKVKDEDKKRMAYDVSIITSKMKLDRYVANALLKYEGLGVS